MKDIKSQDFGIEIETFGIKRKIVAEAVANFFNTRASHEGGTYDVWEVKDTKGRVWKFMYDGSLPNNGSEYGGCEIVSPILYWDDIELIQEVVRTVRGTGARVNGQCGLHIHIGAHHLGEKELTNLVNIMTSHEDILYKAIKVKDNRQKWCKKVNETLIQKLKDQKPDNLNTFKNLWYNTLAPYDSQSEHYNQSRYHGLNLHATFTKGTVEFRMFNSTLHAGRVKAYIQLCMALVSFAEKAKRVSIKKLVSDNEKYSMRVWLIKLGLKGNDFQTCRHHLLKNLEGNSAWR